MRLPESAHTSRPWRVHELTRNFRVEDVWALPVRGAADDFPRLVELFERMDPADAPTVVRMLFDLRWKIGELLAWDEDDGATGRLPFTPLYQLDDEWAGEIANRTVRGVLHLGWVPDGGDAYRGQMAVLVKPNGLLGRAYMAAIMPFRYAVVYPLMLREVGRRWRAPASPAGGSRC